MEISESMDRGQFESIRHAGSADSFQELTSPHQRELLVHCYRILGSLQDAEDALQETLIRAWRRLDTLQSAASLRAWLYKIATNVSLDMLDSRRSRGLASTLFPPTDPQDPLPGPLGGSPAEAVWLEPLPDPYLSDQTASPEALYETSESVSFAFLTALQHLPGRQRAVLLLRDVLGWKAQEVADLLDLTVTTVNSLLQRARATLEELPYRPAAVRIAADQSRTQALLSRYVRAWESADLESLVALLREDAAFTMPPIPAWFQGRTAVAAFIGRTLFSGAMGGPFRLAMTGANGSPAFVLSQPDASGAFQPVALHVLSLAEDTAQPGEFRIARIDDFLDFEQRFLSRFDIQ